jgi:peptidoglycan/LPS O-acetylase OafA/YrhL
MIYRSDINGLRAIAVILVMIFHFDKSLLSGGFIGVDVFFVISGFLMTGIIFNGLSNKTFKFNVFYMSRAKRIVPPLILLCIVLSIYAWLNFYTIELQAFYRHLVGSLAFYSNVVYWQEAGYFTASAHQNWLLHTWSLSVEWQFYIIYPLIIYFFFKVLGSYITKLLVIVGCVLSFALSYFASDIWPDPAYFSLPTRAWQMLSGALVFIYPLSVKESIKPLLSYFGLFLIIISSIFISSDISWPGSLSIIPILGAILLIMANYQNNVFLNNKFSELIGKWSYSIYLWHWPIVVFLYQSNFKLSPTYIVLGIFTSIILGVLSYEIIERKRSNHQLAVFIVLAISLSFFINIHKNGEFKYRPISLSENNEFLVKANKQLNAAMSEKNCNAAYLMSNNTLITPQYCMDRSDRGGLFIWGDSHANALVFGLEKTYQSSFPVNHMFSSGCKPTFHIKVGNASKLRRACDLNNASVKTAIEEIQPHIVLIAQQKEHEKNEWRKTYNYLKAMGVKHVLLVGPVPQWHPSLPLAYVKGKKENEFLISPNFDFTILPTDIKTESIIEQIEGMKYISVFQNLCKVSDSSGEIKCKVKFDESLITYDYGHLTNEASFELAQSLIAPVIDSYYSEISQ